MNIQIKSKWPIKLNFDLEVNDEMAAKIKITKEDLEFIFEVAENGVENEDEDLRYEKLKELVRR